MKLFYGIRASWPKSHAARKFAPTAGAFADDPLSHPAIARMSPRELADLPLGRTTTHCRNR